VGVFVDLDILSRRSTHLIGTATSSFSAPSTTSPFTSSISPPTSTRFREPTHPSPLSAYAWVALGLVLWDPWPPLRTGSVPSSDPAFPAALRCLVKVHSAGTAEPPAHTHTTSPHLLHRRTAPPPSHPLTGAQCRFHPSSILLPHRATSSPDLPCRASYLKLLEAN
jgi:hypothetical protein